MNHNVIFLKKMFLFLFKVSFSLCNLYCVKFVLLLGFMPCEYVTTVIFCIYLFNIISS